MDIHTYSVQSIHTALLVLAILLVEPRFHCARCKGLLLICVSTANLADPSRPVLLRLRRIRPRPGSPELAFLPPVPSLLLPTSVYVQQQLVAAEDTELDSTGRDQETCSRPSHLDLCHYQLSVSH